MRLKNKRARLVLIVLVFAVILGMVLGRHFSARRAVSPPNRPVEVSGRSFDEDAPALEEGALMPSAGEDAVGLSPVVQEVPPVTEEDGDIQPRPEWFADILSVHRSYYRSWLRTDSTVSYAYSSRPDTGSGSPQTSAPASRTNIAGSASSGTQALQPLRRAAGSDGRVAQARGGTADSPTSYASQAGGTPGQFPFPVDTPSPVPGQPGDGGTGEDGVQPPSPRPVTVAREIGASGQVSHVTLAISVNTDINGLIVSETLPPGYALTASSPQYSRKSGDTYSWLIYGRSIQSQTITYDVSGSGGGRISGTYRSTRGSGQTEGRDSL